MIKNKFWGKKWQQLPILLDRCTNEEYDEFTRLLLKHHKLDLLTDLQVYIQYLKDHDQYPEHPIYGKEKRRSMQETNFSKAGDVVNNITDKLNKHLLLHGFHEK